MKFGYVGDINNYMLYRLRYTNKNLYIRVLTYFKSLNLHGYTRQYTRNNKEVYIIEVMTISVIPIIKAKIFTIEENGKKLEQKKKDINKTLF